ncbi:hypothetical protein CSC82_10570 [Rhodobacteraceae bacterium 4F10]|nr:hypothetical protein CSC82_10570 [Rhodobacteraceae bacterium 4F10]
MIISPSVIATTEVQDANTIDPASGTSNRVSGSTITPLADGGFVIAWVSEGDDFDGQDGNGDGVFAQRFDSLGEKVGEEFQVNTTTLFDQRSPAVTALPDGGFFVVWESNGWSDFAGGIFGQRFDQNGARVGEEIQISAPGNVIQSEPEVVSYPDGSIYVGWLAIDNENPSEGIYGRGYNPDMSPVSDEVVLERSSATYSNLSLLAVGQEGVVASWGLRDFRYQISAVFFEDMEGEVSTPLFLTDESRVSAFEITAVQNALYDNDEVFLTWSDYRAFAQSRILTNFQVVLDLDGSDYETAVPLESEGTLGDVVLLGERGIQLVIRDQSVYEYSVTTEYFGRRTSFDSSVIVNSDTSMPISRSSNVYVSAALLNNQTIAYAWDSGSTIAFQIYRVNNFPTGQLNILGSNFVGEALTAIPIGVDDPDGIGDYSYQWFSNEEVIQGATSEIYVLSEENIDQNISVTINFIDGLGTLETIVSETVQNVGISLVGTQANDSLTGSRGNDHIRGLTGNDTILGGSGIDVLVGDDGDDQITGRGTIIGGSGADLIYLLQQRLNSDDTTTNFVEAGDGNDSISGSGNIFAGAGDDIIFVDGNVRDQDENNLRGEGGNDTIYSGDADDFLSGGSGRDSLLAGGGDDTIDGGSDDDRINAGSGRDLVNPGLGLDAIMLGDGDDTVSASSNELHGDTILGPFDNDLILIDSATFFGSPVITHSDGLDTLSLDLTGDSLLDFQLNFGDANLELAKNVFQVDEGILINRIWIVGTENDEWIDGTRANNTIEGLAGADTLKGYDGDDWLEGGPGGSTRGDSLLGGDGNDTLYGVTFNDPEGDDQTRDYLNGGEGHDLLVAGAGNDHLRGEEDNDTLYGGSGSDYLFGAHGSDQLYGGSGTDELDGGTGNDLLYGGSDNDFLLGYWGDDTVFGEWGRDVLIGDRGSDILWGGTGSDTAEGGIGQDTLYGENGDDSLSGGDDADSLSGGDGNDTLIGGEGDDTLIGGDTEDDLRDIIYGGNGNDSVDGSYGNDELRGDAGDDIIAGGFGADTVIGGTGNDTLTGSAFADNLFGGGGGDFVNGGWGHDLVNGGAESDRFFHIGIEDHGSDWIQDYNSTEGDILQFGIVATTADQFQVNFSHTSNDAGERSGDDSIAEAFVVFRPTGQIMWALVDGAGQNEINLRVSGSDEVFDLLG